MAYRYAIISVWEKTGLVDFARQLEAFDFGIIATGATHKTLVDAGIVSTEVSEYTGCPEMFEGRVKTLHPKIHAGILHTSCPEHLEQIASMDIPSIELVVSNLYPFRYEKKRSEITDDEMIEMIDIGGPTLIRAAAKNFSRVGVVSDPSDYDLVIKELALMGGNLSLTTRKKLAAKAFKIIALYDHSIYAYFYKSLGMIPFDEDEFVMAFEKVHDLKYGENPHQLGALYRRTDERQLFPDYVEFLSGKDMGFCNYLDAEGALSLMCEFERERPFSVIVKHANPVGASYGETELEAFERARGVDEMSSFGGIIGINGKVSSELAIRIKEVLFHILMADDYDPEAIELLSKNKNRIIIKLHPAWREAEQMKREMKLLRTSTLVQEWDSLFTPVKEWDVMTERKPDKGEQDDLWMAWRVCKHIKSNAILLARNGQTIGTGAGQMSRIDSLKIAIDKAGENVEGSVLASDAFFPFEDSIELAHKAGITAIIQPGGSIRDKHVIAKCNELGIAMVFTRNRHFRH